MIAKIIKGNVNINNMGTYSQIEGNVGTYNNIGANSNTNLNARDIVTKSLEIAAGICVYTNEVYTIEELEINQGEQG